MADYEDTKTENKPFTLFNNETGQSYEIPVLSGSVGPGVLDIRSLYKETGMFTYDPGFTSTASCESSITYIDGNKGILRHRGYDIKDLTTNSNFLEALSLYVYDRDYFNINFQIPYTIRSKWGFTETKQYEKEDGKFKFNYRTKSPQGGVPTFFVAKSPLAYGLISVTKIHTPSGVYLLTNLS